MKNNLYLVFVNPLGVNSMDLYEYEFFFSETPDVVWGEDWNEECPAACGKLLPDSSTYSNVKRLKTNIKFSCAQEQTCFSMQDCIDGCICLAYESLEGLDTYPEPYRIVFKFGEDYDSVEEKLASRSQIFEDILAD